MKRITWSWGKLTACVGALACSLPAVADELDARTVTNATELAAAVANNTVIYMVPGDYVLTAPLDLTNTHRCYIKGNGSFLRADGNEDWADKFLIEMQGCDRSCIEDLFIRQDEITEEEDFPAGAILLGRTQTNQSGGRHLFESLIIDGEYEFSAVVNVCSEVNTWINCYVHNGGDAASDSSHAFYMSTLGPISTWAQSTAYAANVFIRPTTPNGFMYQADINGGTSGGGAEPTWPTTIGNTVVDNDITWTCFAIGPIASADFSGIEGPALFLSTMSGQTFINTHFSRFWTTVNQDDACVYLDNTGSGSFGNFSWYNCWFNANTSGAGTSETNGLKGLIVVHGTIIPIWNLDFENCVSEVDYTLSALYVKGTSNITGLRWCGGHWSTAERVIHMGQDTILQAAYIADDQIVPQGGHDWSYTSADAFDKVNNGTARCLYDFYTNYNVTFLTPQISCIQQNATTTAVRGALGAGQSTGDTRAWSMVRARGLSNRSSYTMDNYTDLLPLGTGGSQISRDQFSGEQTTRVFDKREIILTSAFARSGSVATITGFTFDVAANESYRVTLVGETENSAVNNDTYLQFATASGTPFGNTGSFTKGTYYNALGVLVGSAAGDVIANAFNSSSQALANNFVINDGTTRRMVVFEFTFTATATATLNLQLGSSAGTSTLQPGARMEIIRVR